MNINHAFSAGELDPDLWGRSDIDRYFLGAASLRNFLVNFGGMAAFRPGNEFAEFSQFPNDPHRFFRFEFSPDASNSFLVVFGGGRIRFVLDGQYLHEAPQGVTSITAGIVSATTHGYANNDFVYIDSLNATFIVANAVANSFELRTVDNTPTVVSSGATVARRVVTLLHPYAGSELRQLRASQFLNEMKFTHPAHPPMILTFAAPNFTFTEEQRNAGTPLAGGLTAVSSGHFIRSVRVTAPGSGHNNGTALNVTDATGTGAKLIPTIQGDQIIGVTVLDGGERYTAPTVTATPGAGATFVVDLSPSTAEFVWTVTAIIDGNETGMFRPRVMTGMPNITVARGWYEFSWPAIPGAEGYNIYRSVVFPNAGAANLGVELGFIGTTRARKFVDGNVQPDFTRQPPIYSDPFAPGAITHINVLGSAATFTHDSVLNISDPSGTGFVGWPIVQDGSVTGIFIANPGRGYVNPTITSPSGALTLSIQRAPLDGVYPSTSFRFQSRAGYAGTRNNPMTIWGSAVGEPKRLASRPIANDDDPFSYELDVESVQPIRDAVPAQQGLLVFTAKQIALLRGEDGVAVTPTGAVREPQTFVGAAEVPPATLGDDILYVATKRAGLRLLQFSREIRRYVSREITAVSRHLFRDHEVIAVAPTSNSDYRGYGVLANGEAFTFTIQPQENVYAFAPMDTPGDFLDAVTLDVGNEEHVYFLVRRQGRLVIERQRPRRREFLEDAVHVDSFTSREPDRRPGSLTCPATSGNVVVTASQPAFNLSDVGSFIGLGGGRGVIITFFSSTSVEVEITRPVPRAGFIPTGSWWVADEVTQVSGVPHEGRTVRVIGDGKYLGEAPVVGGVVQLPSPAAVVHVGFPYQGVLETLPPPQTEGREINIVQVAILHNRMGGPEVNDVAIALRSEEAWAEPNNPELGEHRMVMKTGWGDNKRVRIEVNDSLPCEILRITSFFIAGGTAYANQPEAIPRISEDDRDDG